MKVRKPSFDFSAASPHWCPDREFGVTWNAASMMLPTLEPFLNRVITRVRAELSDSDPQTEALREELVTFVRQEGVHYKIHQDFNNILHAHYPGLDVIESKMERYYADIFKTQPMRFLTGFCESFEMVGPILAHFWLDSFNDLLEQSQPVVVNMWKWHWAEEYEHRTACWRAYARYSNSYPHRLYMLVQTQLVLKRFQYELIDHMLKIDRASMTAAERRASVLNESRWKRLMVAKMLPPLLRGALPFHSPAGMAPPRNYAGFLSWFEADMPRASRSSFQSAMQHER